MTGTSGLAGSLGRSMSEPVETSASMRTLRASRMTRVQLFDRGAGTGVLPPVGRPPALGIICR